MISVPSDICQAVEPPPQPGRQGHVIVFLISTRNTLLLFGFILGLKVIFQFA
jgi:hypothetical protein